MARLPQSVLDGIAADIRNGMVTSAIMAVYGVSRATVQRVAHIHGLLITPAERKCPLEFDNWFPGCGVPSPDEIRQATAAIRATWSETVRIERYVGGVPWRAVG